VLRVNRFLIAALLIGGGLALIAVPLAFAAGSIIQSRICLPFGTPTITNPAQDYTEQADSVTVSGAADANAVVDVTDNGTGSGATTADNTGAYSISIPLAYGSNMLQAHVTNACGTVNSSNSVTVTHPAPVVPPTETTTSSTAQSQPAVLNLQPITEPTTPTGASAASNTSSTTKPYTPPTILSPLSGLVVTVPYVLLVGRATPGTVVQIRNDGHIVAQVITPTNGIFSANVPLQDGINNLVTEIMTQSGAFTSKVIVVSYAPVHISDRGIVRRAVLTIGVGAIAIGAAIIIHAVLARVGITFRRRKFRFKRK